MICISNLRFDLQIRLLDSMSTTSVSRSLLFSLNTTSASQQYQYLIILTYKCLQLNCFCSRMKGCNHLRSLWNQTTRKRQRQLNDFISRNYHQIFQLMQRYLRFIDGLVTANSRNYHQIFQLLPPSLETVN